MKTKKRCTCGQGIQLPSHQIRHCDGNTAFPRSFSLSCDGHQRIWPRLSPHTCPAPETEPSPTFSFATVRLKLQLPITCLSYVVQHSRLHDSLSHNPSCYVNDLKPKHSFFALSRSLIFSCHLLNFWVEDKFSDTHLQLATRHSFFFPILFNFFYIVLFPPQTHTSKKQRSRTSTAEREGIWAASTQSCRMCRGSW